ncbi:MAG: Abi family protein [Lachnospiraceae bacterium]|nr:Abi family protein [Lachnospiraceae bacterium]
MSNRIDKPKLTPKKIVEKMRDEKGITFNHISEDDAVEFLTNHNNYLRTACYRVVYSKYQAGPNKGKYINLDFAYLKELSIIDMHYRFTIKKMCSDIEHSLCMMLLKQIDEDETTDGYDIVEKFLDSHPYAVQNLERSIGSPHTGDLIKKYFTVTSKENTETGKTVSTISLYNDCPAWVLVECLTFGDLLEFYSFYARSRNIELPATWSTLSLVRNLRNGASHDVCLLCHLQARTSVPPQELTVAVKNIPNITTSKRQKKLSSRTVLEFVALVYLYNKVVHGEVYNSRAKELQNLFSERFTRKKEYFQSNDIICSTYNFCYTIIKYFLLAD